jgi:hypothetical protein
MLVGEKHYSQRAFLGGKRYCDMVSTRRGTAALRTDKLASPQRESWRDKGTKLSLLPDITLPLSRKVVQYEALAACRTRVFV